MEIDNLANTGVSVLTTVAILAIVSIGLAVVFGMMGIINLAHGEFIMLGAFFTLTGHRAGLNIWLAMICATLAVGAVGVLVERLLIRFLYGRLIETMLATWGLSLILIQTVVMIYGPATRGIPTPLGSVRIGEYAVSEYNLVLIAAALGLLTSVLIIFTKTKYGTKARAVTQAPQMAAALGINSRMTNMVTFGIGTALAGAAGALLAPLTGVLPGMGQAYIGKSFMTVVVGGPGVLTGTSSASVLLGGVDSLVSNAMSPFLGSAALLIVAIVIIRFFPMGISGRFGRRL